MTKIAATGHLPIEECWELLRRTSVGRLAVDIAGRPDVFPINYVVDEGTVVFRTGAGTKLAGAVLGRHVAFEIDGYLPEERVAWSVVVKGTARPIDRMVERYRAEDLPLFPWVASDKPDFVCVLPSLVTGRRFVVTADVTPDSSVGWNAAPTQTADTADASAGAER